MVDIFVAKIRHNPTQEVRDVYLSVDEFDIYLWESGNFSCDCNRCIFFKCTELESYGSGAYSVNLIKNGRVVYREY